MAQGGKSEMYLKSVAALNHYIIHMHEKQYIIYQTRFIHPVRAVQNIWYYM